MTECETPGSRRRHACKARIYLAGFRGAFWRDRGRSQCLRQQAQLRDLHIYLLTLHGPRHLIPRIPPLTSAPDTPEQLESRARSAILRTAEVARRFILCLRSGASVL